MTCHCEHLKLVEMRLEELEERIAALEFDLDATVFEEADEVDPLVDEAEEVRAEHYPFADVDAFAAGYVEGAHREVEE